VIENLLNILTKVSSDNEILLKILENNKVDCEIYTNEINRVNKKFLDSNLFNETTNNKIDLLNNYIDKQFQFKIQLIISQTLHFILDNNTRKTLMD